LNNEEVGQERRHLVEAQSEGERKETLWRDRRPPLTRDEALFEKWAAQADNGYIKDNDSTTKHSMIKIASRPSVLHKPFGDSVDELRLFPRHRLALCLQKLLPHRVSFSKNTVKFKPNLQLSDTHLQERRGVSHDKKKLGTLTCLREQAFVIAGFYFCVVDAGIL
jgi:hypothetical protein